MYVPTGADDVFAVSVDTGKILLGVQGEPRPEDQHRLLRLAQPRRRARRRQGLPRPARRQARRARPDDRQVALEDAVGDWQERVHDHGRAALLRRPASTRGISGGEFCDPRARSPPTTRRPASEVWRFYTDPRPGRDRATTPGRPGQRRRGSTAAPGLADAGRRPRARAALLLDRQRRARPRTAAGAPATTSSPPRSSPSTPRPGSTAGTSSRSTTTSGTTTRPSPIVLFDAEIDGEVREGPRPGRRRPAGSTCSTARPASRSSPIAEQPVPQLRERRRPPKTQPIPSYPPFFPHEVTRRGRTQESQRAARSRHEARRPSRSAPKTIFTPFGETTITVDRHRARRAAPTGSRRATTPSTEHVLRLRACAASRRLLLENEELPAGQAAARPPTLGSVFTSTGLRLPGRLLRRDRRDDGRDRLAEALADESCYSRLGRRPAATSSSSAATTGELEAYNAENGEGPLWSFQTGAGANNDRRRSSSRTGRSTSPSSPAATRSPRRSTATISGSSRSTGRWTRSRPAARARGPATPARRPTEPTDEGEGDAEAGETVWTDNCAGCHGLDGTGANGGPNLVGNRAGDGS